MAAGHAQSQFRAKALCRCLRAGNRACAPSSIILSWRGLATLGTSNWQGSCALPRWSSSRQRETSTRNLAGLAGHEWWGSRTGRDNKISETCQIDDATSAKINLPELTRVLLATLAWDIDETCTLSRFYKALHGQVGFQKALWRRTRP
jgi:hypothetical protein